MTITWFTIIWPLLLSNRCPARMAVVFRAGGQLKMPPSAPTHGVGPAPRQGAGGAAGPCAKEAEATNRNANANVFIGGPSSRLASGSSRTPRTPEDASAADRS